MKFAHIYLETLASQDFPAEWQAAAIQYRQLKKCIKRVQSELAELGLNAETLKLLLAQQTECAEGGPVLQYMFDGDIHSFQPKLVLTVYGREGLHEVDMGLSKDTRRSLERLLKQQGIPGSGRATVITDGEDSSPEGSDMESISETVSSRSSESDDEPKEEPVSVVEIPLLHNTEFFHILTTELEALDAVQTTAAKTIEKEIVLIGNQVTAVSNPRSSIVSRSDLYPWREIFRIYLEMGIFFSNLEVEQHQERTVEDAQARLNKFRFEMERMGLPKSFKNRQSQALFGRFIEVNEEVLRVLRFQAINKMAMTKILKKFDKRTALGIRQTFPVFVASSPFLASHLAKAICFTMSSKLLTLLPQLEDYLCPICQSIAVKPVRLSCSHVFCVRCLVKLQREKKRLCPMCRSDVVLDADATNMDASLLNFLKAYFPKEAREKQKENEQEVVMEQWRNVQVRSGNEQSRDGCAMM